MEKMVEIDGKVVDYVDVGKGRKILFLHGLAVPLKKYLSLIESLSKKYWVIAPEIPLRGSLKGYNDFLEKFLKKVDFRPRIIVSHSLGTVISACYSDKRKDVRFEISINPPLGMSPLFFDNIIRMLRFRNRIGLGNLPFLLHGAKNFVAYNSVFRNVHSVGYEDRGVGHKKLLIHSGRDELFKLRKKVEKKIRAKKNIKLVILPDATHALPISDFKKTSKIVLGFLKKGK